MTIERTVESATALRNQVLMLFLKILSLYLAVELVTELRFPDDRVLTDVGL